MVDNFVVLEVAKREFHQVVCYFELYNRSEEFLSDFEAQIEMIKIMPYAFQIRYKQIRVIKFSAFQYSIHYKIIGSVIYILHVLNQRQSY